MHLINKQDDLTGGGSDLAEDGFQAFFELASVFCARDQCTHVERHERLIAQAFRHVAIDDAQGEAFGDGGFANARLTNQNGVVLGAAGQHLHGAANLIVAADDRVDLAVAGGLSEVTGEFLQRLIAVFGAGAVGRAALAQVINRGIEVLGGDRTCSQRVLGRGFDHGQSCQQAFHGHKTVARLAGDFLRLIQYAHQLAVRAGVGGRTADLGLLGERCVHSLAHAIRRATRAGDQVGGKAFAVVQKRFQQMFGGQLRMAVAHRNGLSRLQEAPRPLGELVQVHVVSPRSAPFLSRARPAARGARGPQHINGQRGGLLQGLTGANLPHPSQGAILIDEGGGPAPHTPWDIFTKMMSRLRA